VGHVVMSARSLPMGR